MNNHVFHKNLNTNKLALKKDYSLESPNNVQVECISVCSCAKFYLFSMIFTPI